MTTIRPWACFVITGKNVESRHFETEAQAREYAKEAKGLLVETVVTRANRRTAKRYDKIIVAQSVQRIRNLSKTTQKVVALKPARRQKRAVNLTFEFMAVG